MWSESTYILLDRGGEQSTIGKHDGGSSTYSLLERKQRGIGWLLASMTEAAALTACWNKECLRGSRGGDRSAFGEHVGGSSTYMLLEQGERGGDRSAFGEHVGGGGTHNLWKKEQRGDRSTFSKHDGGSGTYILLDRAAGRESVSLPSGEGIDQPAASTSEAAALTNCCNKEQGGNRSAFACWKKERGGNRSAFGEHVGGSSTYMLLEKGAGRGSVSLWRVCQRQRHLHADGKKSREGIDQPSVSMSEAAALTRCWTEQQGGDRSAVRKHDGGSGTYTLLDRAAGRGSISGGKHDGGSGTYTLLEQAVGRGLVSRQQA
ncbi:hypothetical protein B0H17DRAFT_1136950 [Mycena rosella]|uniref:Uncharacterized protein n=1 Tax=Mycena rosella TaxID=1033263 RepID=A0AAD7D9S3_MYCRO|nr:hypothetical protein B0H17DRAFT_1136950 [Mycena rosella]